MCALATGDPAPAHASTAQASLPDAMAIGSSDTAGPIYTTAAGMTLYRNGMDEPENGKFGCGDIRYERTPGEEGYPIPGAAFRSTCVDRWRPYQAGPDATAMAAFGIVERPDGARQWGIQRVAAVHLHPRPGSRRCQRHHGFRALRPVAHRWG